MRLPRAKSAPGGNHAGFMVKFRGQMPFFSMLTTIGARFFERYMKSLAQVLELLKSRLPKLFSAGRADVRLDSVWAGLRFLV